MCKTATHGDHSDDVGALQKRFPKVRILVGPLSAEPLVKLQNLDISKIYKVNDGQEFKFGEVTIKAFAGRHTEGSGSAHIRAELLACMISRIDLHKAGIDLTVDKMGLSAALKIEPTTEMTNRSIMLTLPATKVRRGHQLRLVIPGPQVISIAEATWDNKLFALIVEAHQARLLILATPKQSIAAIASRHGRCRTRLGKLAVLGCLAPDIVTAIVEGRQPATLSARILQDIDLPLAWADQRAMLGFA